MPQQKINLRPKGLYTNVNQLGTVPAGALTETLNCVLSKPNILGVRRGEKTQHIFGNLVGDTWQAPNFPLRLSNAKLRVGGTLGSNYLGDITPGMVTMMSDGSLWWSDGHDEPTMNFTQIAPSYGQEPLTLSPSVPVDIHAGTVPFGSRHWYAFEAQNAFFLVTSEGIIRIGRPHPTFDVVPPPVNPTAAQISDWQKSGYSRAGVPWGLNTQAALAGVGTAITNATAVAYRAAFGFRDASNIVHIGAPSTRVVLQNAGVTVQNATIRTQVPPDIIPGKHFYQIYRTLSAAPQTVDPGDDAGLLAEREVPANMVVDQSSRTGTTATLRTNAPHSLVANDVVALVNDIIGPSTPVNDEYFVEITGTTLRNIYRKNGPGAGFALTGSFNVTKEAGAPTTSVKLLFARDTLNSKMYYMESNCSAIYVITNAGVYSTALSISGYIPDIAYALPDGSKILMVCRPPGASPTTFDYQANNFWCIIYNPNLGVITTQTQSPALQSSWHDGIGYYMYPGILNGTDTDPFYTKPKAVLGAWRASFNSALFWVLCLPSKGTCVNAFISGDDGTSWSYQITFLVPRHFGSLSVVALATASDTIVNPSTGELSMAFSTVTHDVAFPITAGDTYYSHLLYIENNGFGQPLVTRNNACTKTVSALGGTYPTEILDIKFNKFAGTPYYIEKASVLSASVPAKAYALQGTYKANGALVVGSGVNLGIAGQGPVPTVYPSAYLIDTSAVNDIMLAGIYASSAVLHYLVPSNAMPPDPALLESVLAGAPLVAPATSLAPPAAVIPVIRAGAYLVLTAATPLFTIKSLQSPQTDFGNTPTNGTVAYAEVSFTDAVIPAAIGPLLYTSPSVEGIAQSNYPPPLCDDATLFRTTAFYANATQRTTLTFAMTKQPTAGTRVYIGNSSSEYITGQLVGGGGEIISDRQFLIGTDGSAAQMRVTLESMARVINCNWRIFRNMMMLSAFGQFAFAQFTLTGILPTDVVSFRHTANDGITLGQNTFSPDNQTGQTIKEKNVLYFSKSNIPGSVPLLNSIRIGADTKEILRIYASRDSLFIFKEEGAFILRGYGPPWQVDPFDLTLRLALRDSLAGLDNAVFGVFTRGIFKVTDSNAELVSLPIQDQIERQIGGDLKLFANEVAFGLGDNADHKYCLWIPETESDEKPSKVLVWDTYTNEWTTWAQPARHGITSLQNILHFAGQTYCYTSNQAEGFANGDYPSILEERKSYIADDFIGDNLWRIPDVSNAVAKTHRIIEHNPSLGYVRFRDAINFSTLPDMVIVTAPTELVTNQWKLKSLGWGYNQGGQEVMFYRNTPADVTAIIGTGTISFDCNIWKTIQHGFRFSQAFPESPLASNHFSEVSFSFRKAYFDSLRIGFGLPFQDTGEFSLNDYIDVAGDTHFPDGERQYVDDQTRTYVTKNQQRGSALSVRMLVDVMGWDFETNGMGLVLTQGPTSFGRR